MAQRNEKKKNLKNDFLNVMVLGMSSAKSMVTNEAKPKCFSFFFLPFKALTKVTVRRHVFLVIILT